MLPENEKQPGRDVYSISRLNREVRTILEGSFPLLWVEGEISNFACPASGHWYFTLKDEAAQVRCAMFRNRNMLTRIKPENGMQVLIRARISMYEARGEFQIIAEHMEEAGDGALQRAFEELKAKLGKEGLFDSQHKKTVPSLPKQIGVITSPTGAAIRDILIALKRRFPSIPVIVYPVAVQGNESAGQIVSMIERANQRKECDVLLLARGGGSMEDLWSFNEESVARSIYASNIPIVSGIGHEVDFTIADFVADFRAATPTAAAEHVTPDQYEVLSAITNQSRRLYNLLHRKLAHDQQKLQWLQKRLPHPARQLYEKTQRLDELQRRYFMAIRHFLRHTSSRLGGVSDRIKQQNPSSRISLQKTQLQHTGRQLLRNMRNMLEKQKTRLMQNGHSLHTVSPLATLERGYAIVLRDSDDKLVRTSTQVKIGEKIRARLSKGELLCKVEHVSKKDST